MKNQGYVSSIHASAEMSVSGSSMYLDFRYTVVKNDNFIKAKPPGVTGNHRVWHTHTAQHRWYSDIGKYGKGEPILGSI